MPFPSAWGSEFHCAGAVQAVTRPLRHCLCLLKLWPLASTAQLGPRPVLLLPSLWSKAGRLLHPRTGNVSRRPACVLIEGEQDQQVGSSSQYALPRARKIIYTGARDSDPRI